MNPPRSRLRLDLLLLERGLFESREKAQRAIMAGEVWVEGERRDKAGTPTSPHAIIEVRAAERFVSRGGHKLEGALKEFCIDPAGWHCMDVGSSTGGFTDCLLQHGATGVTAIDVGRGQLHWKLRQDPRVDLHEGVNARDLGAFAHMGRTYQLAVADLSFISLRLVLPAVFPLLSAPGHVIALIKPQFEVGKGMVGKGGIVRDPALHQEVLDGLTTWLDALQASLSQTLNTAGIIPSPILGREGNKEFLWWIKTGSPSNTTPPSAWASSSIRIKPALM
ncbi:MAG: TlyA family RNA methyltransferase [Candidatus Methylacidiphilales bacterium]|nr:TlyA family RNA methyltransferase [Candidatus Methylacidiphilales bacterium]